MSESDLSRRELVANLFLILSIVGFLFGAPGVIEDEGGPSAWGSGGFAMFADGPGDNNNQADSEDPAIWIGVESRVSDTLITTEQKAEVEVRLSNDDHRLAHDVDFELVVTENGYRDTVILRDTITIPAGETKEVTYEFSPNEVTQSSISYPHTVWVDTVISSDEGRVGHSSRATSGQITFRLPQWERFRAQLFVFSFVAIIVSALASPRLRRGVIQLRSDFRHSSSSNSSPRDTLIGSIGVVSEITGRLLKLSSQGSKEHRERFSDDPGISLGALFLSYLVCLPVLLLAGTIVIVTETLDEFFGGITAYNGTIITYLFALYVVLGFLGYFVALGTSRE